MGQPAARVGDMHVCPMVTPGTPPIPHVGGPILPPGKPNVMIGKMPAATITGMCVCTGPPDTISKGSSGVMIGSMPAARMGDLTVHGGTIVKGEFTVMIGEASPGAPPVIVPPIIFVGPVSNGKGSSIDQALNTLRELAQMLPEPAASATLQAANLIEAASNGTPFCEECMRAQQEEEGLNQEQGNSNSDTPSNDESQAKRESMNNAAQRGDSHVIADN